MQIRFAIPEDVPGILSLLRQVGEVHHNGRPDIFRAGAQKYGASQVLGMLDKPATPIFVAVNEEEKVLGYAFCIYEEVKNNSSLCDRKTVYIDDLCVDASERGQHIGTVLYEHVLEESKREGCVAVTLNVWCLNEGAMRFYEKLGMKPLKVVMEHKILS